MTLLDKYLQLLRTSAAALPGITAGAIVGVIVVVAQGSLNQTSALNVSSPRDCDSNAVINCGALTTAELKDRYSQRGVADIYKYFSISTADVQATDKTAVAGRVYKDGTVRVGNVTVATGAVTAGRQNIAGSTPATSGNTSFYTRTPSVSFRSDSLAAFVVMEKGRFKFAVLGACGNPVKATPVAQPEPLPTPVPPAPAPTPLVGPPTPTPEVTPQVSTQTPVSTPTASLAGSPQPDELPSVGPAAVLVIALFSAIGGYAFHMTHRQVKHKRHVRHAVKHR